MGRVEGKVAFITGAARGQGRSHAIRLAEEGADIIAVDFVQDLDSVPYGLGTREEFAETVRSVESLGRRIVAIEADVRDYPQLKAAVDQGVRELGRLDIVSANAGVLSLGKAHELPEQTWQDMIDINLTGVWHTTKAVTEPMIDLGNGGSIIITSSTAGVKGLANAAHYTAAKHGVVGLMRSLVNELSEYRIRVNTVHPTQVDTPLIMNKALWKVFRPDLEDPTVEDFRVPSLELSNLPDVPWMDVRDVSNALLFLASDEARYISGTTLWIDAGSMTK
jgi:SDR family mycofactocin-dependent oxidoreductase